MTAKATVAFPDIVYIAVTLSYVHVLNRLNLLLVFFSLISFW